MKEINFGKKGKCDHCLSDLGKVFLCSVCNVKIWYYKQPLLNHGKVECIIKKCTVPWGRQMLELFHPNVPHYIAEIKLIIGWMNHVYWRSIMGHGPSLWLELISMYKTVHRTGQSGDCYSANKLSLSERIVALKLTSLNRLYTFRFKF